MIFYIILTLVFSVCGLVKIKDVKETSQLRFFFLILFLLATFRSVTVGSDTINYYRIFKSIANSGEFVGLIERFEVGYLILNRVISIISDNFTIFLGILNLIIYYAYYIFVKKYSNNYGLSLFLFFTLGYWGQTVNTIRLELAVAMFIYSYVLIEEGRKIPAVVCGIVGVLFQRISLVFFALFFIPKKLSRGFIYIATFATIIIFVFLDSVVEFVVLRVPYFAHYLSLSKYTYGEVKISIVIQLIMHLIIFFVCYRYYKRLQMPLDEKAITTIESQLNLTYTSALVLFLSMKFNLLDRCETIFGIFTILLLPNICKVKINRNRDYLFTVGIITVGFAYFVIINYFRPEWNQIIPYHTFLYDK